MTKFTLVGVAAVLLLAFVAALTLPNVMGRADEARVSHADSAVVAARVAEAKLATRAPVVAGESSGTALGLLAQAPDDSAASGQRQHLGPTLSPLPANEMLRLRSEATYLVQEPDRENYGHVDDNPVRAVVDEPVSTFSIDVDTASYANVRRFLSHGRLPPRDAVRVEEIINYFDYGYAGPRANEGPFAVHTELGPSPWHPKRRLLHIGIQGASLAREEVPAANLVFLVDVSGSMRSPDKLGLLKSSLRLLTGEMRPQDRVSLVVYAGAAGVVLEPTPGSKRSTILAAIDQLEAGGSTNGGAGIELAYTLAAQGAVEGGVNRVILATDGDFNVGTVDHQRLEALVERKRESGVALTVLGFGSGNYQDALMQRLAQIGNGNAAYVDTLNEARKVLVEELSSTLAIIAQDVKLQVEFNPAVVSEYRLIGYETRQLAREDFNNDRIDAGELGAGHTVTALYELTLVGEGGEFNAPLRYGDRRPPRFMGRPVSDEVAFLRLRYKAPGAGESELRERPISLSAGRDSLAATSEAFRFSAAAASYGQLLRGGRYTGEFRFDEVLALARGARGADPFGYRSEFLSLVASADALSSIPGDERGAR
ncbi:MAG: VWA domain-containing protein [Pseudomonadota bacterium]